MPQRLPLFLLVTTCLVSLTCSPAYAVSLQDIGDLPGGTIYSVANDVNTDGLVIVGQGTSASGNEAFRWTQGGGMVGLGDLAGGIFISVANAVSSDGSIVVGHSTSANGPEAFRWTQGGGMVGLGDLAGGSFGSVANGVSADGLVIVGRGTSASGNEAFRWTQGGGMVGLGDLAGGSFSSSANDVNADGSVIVGQSISANGTEAFRWTQGGGMVGLGDLADGTFNSAANAISADGSVVVGRGRSASGDEAFHWTQSDGMRSVKDLLTAANVDTTNWSLTNANGISANGTIIVGNGTFNGDTVAYLANVATGGLTTPQALAESLNTVTEASQHASITTMQYLPQSLFIAQHVNEIATPVSSYTPVALDDEPSFAALSPAAGGPLWRSRLSAFIQGSYGFDDDPRTDQFNGTIGVTMEVADNLNIGLGMIGGASRNDLAFDGSSDLDALGGVLLGSYQPEETGWRVYGTVYVAHLNLDTTRGYLNGSALDFSSGEMDGLSYGVAARVGWEENVINQSTLLMPYIEGRYSKTEIDGYAEKDGAFAATFSDQKSDHISSRLGIELKHTLNDKVEILFRPAWGHRFSGDGDAFTADVSGLTQSLRGDAGDRDWAEATIGGTWQASDRLHLSTELTGRTGNTGQPAATIMIGAFLKF